MARDYRSKMPGVRLLAALLLFIPLAASATIYQWTDEQGHVVIGNQVPEAARDVRPVMKEDAAPANGTRELEARIARLEQQVQAQQAQQYAPPAAYPTPPMPYPAAPAPMPADYYGAGYYPGMYPPPPYYPYGYGYGYPFGVVTVVRPVHRFARVAHFRPVVTHFASRPFAAHFASRSVAMHHAAVGRR
jgi:hypothetical protein